MLLLDWTLRRLRVATFILIAGTSSLRRLGILEHPASAFCVLSTKLPRGSSYVINSLLLLPVKDGNVSESDMSEFQTAQLFETQSTAVVKPPHQPPALPYYHYLDALNLHR